MQSREADVALVIAYGRILPAAVLTAPRRGCMNLHASLLPELRGAAPITWAIVRGASETGISFMQMDEGCDTGPVYTRHRIPIGEDMTADELGAALAHLAADVVRADLERAVRGEIVAEPQDGAAATMAPILKKEDGRVPWTLPAKAVHDHVRGMTSWPGAFTSARGKRLVILASRIADNDAVVAAPGTVTRADRTGIEVACGRGTVAVLRAQLEGRKALAAPELVAGRAISAGEVLGA
jgi:methionyl-tRNA formyltransferase